MSGYPYPEVRLLIESMIGSSVWLIRTYVFIIGFGCVSVSCNSCELHLRSRWWLATELHGPKPTRCYSNFLDMMLYYKLKSLAGKEKMMWWES